MRIHPGGFRLVLVGPKVSRLLPFLQHKGFVGDAFSGGLPALEHLRHSPCHVLCIELELGDMMGIDLARCGKEEGTVGATLLLEDPIKSGMVVSALARGIDAFVPVPPDESVLLERLESLLLAQWGLVVTSQQQQLTEELARARVEAVTAREHARRADVQLEDVSKNASRDVADERRKVQDLVREIASLRDQLATMHLVTGAKTGTSDEGRSTQSGEGRNADAEATDDFENEVTLAATMALGQMLADARPEDFENDKTPDGVAPLLAANRNLAYNDEATTAPAGHQVPLPLAPLKLLTTTANMDMDLRQNLPRIPAEEEVIFFEDE